MSNDKPLTPEEKRRRAKYIVYPFSACCAWGSSCWYSARRKRRRRKWKRQGFQRGDAFTGRFGNGGQQGKRLRAGSTGKKENGAGEPSRKCPNCSTRTVRILPVLPQESKHGTSAGTGKGESPRLHPFLCRSLPEYEPFAGHCIYPE